MPRFQDDFYNHTFALRVREDFLSGIRSGVNGTPTFYINGMRYNDSWDQETLTKTLRDIINEIV
jgi:protein-disulfide isomerase